MPCSVFLCIIAVMKIFKPTMGAYSVADDLAQKLLRRWVPKWYGAFTSAQGPLFFERLGHSFKPLLTPRLRLLSQLRQLAMYAHATTQPESRFFKPDLKKYFDGIVNAYTAGPKGAWVFAINETDATLDLYTHAFVIFAFAHYGQATKDEAAHQQALATLAFLNTNFRVGGIKGFVEVVGKPMPRRHESHMHLLEACLAAYNTWQDAAFKAVADELVALFFSDFYNAENNILSEYFDDDLNPIPDANTGKIICEPGHYYEWIWLLKKHASLSDNPKIYDATCLALLAWANKYGWDDVHGGIYDELTTDGSVVTQTKRLWPFTEGLKANALMLSAVPDRDAAKDLMIKMTQLFRDKYIDTRGFWTEWLNRDLSPAVDYMPATTPYHVYFGIMETLTILKQRGASKSWRAGPRRLSYAMSRFFSAWVRNTRSKLVKIQSNKISC